MLTSAQLLDVGFVSSPRCEQQGTVGHEVAAGHLAHRLHLVDQRRGLRQLTGEHQDDAAGAEGERQAH